MTVRNWQKVSSLQGTGIGLEAPVPHLEHLELDAGEQGHVDVEYFA